MKLILTPHGEYQFTENGKPTKNLFVLDVEYKLGVYRITAVYNGIVEGTKMKKQKFKSSLEDLLKPKGQ